VADPWGSMVAAPLAARSITVTGRFLIAYPEGWALASLAANEARWRLMRGTAKIAYAPVESSRSCHRPCASLGNTRRAP